MRTQYAYLAHVQGRIPKVKLNHLNLTVTDVRAAAGFLETYFGLTNEGGNAGMAFVRDDDGFVLSLTKRGRSETAPYPCSFHVGFFVEHEATVDEVHRRLRADGHDVADPERRHAYGFYVEAPGGFTVELGA